MKIDNVIFDLDGTLLDTTEGVLESAIYAAKQMGYMELSKSTMLKFVGPPIQNSFQLYYGCDIETAQLAANIFRDYYKNNSLLKAEPYEGIFQLCQELKNRNIKMAVATYKREDYAISILQYFGFDKYCISMHGADNNNKLRKSDIVNICVDELGGCKEKCVLIGDTIHDAIGAEEANVNFIGVTYGFGFSSCAQVEKYKNIGIAHTPMEILKFIEL